MKHYEELRKLFPLEPDKEIRKLLNSKNPKDAKKYLEKKYGNTKTEKSNTDVIEEIQKQFPSFPKEEIISLYQQNFSDKWQTIADIKEKIAIIENSRPKTEIQITDEPEDEETRHFITLNIEKKSAQEAEEFLKYTLDAAKSFHNTDRIKIIISTGNTDKNVFLKKRSFALQYATKNSGFKAELDCTNTGVVLIYPKQQPLSKNQTAVIPFFFEQN